MLLLRLLLLVLVFALPFAQAQLNVSPLYVSLSDAMSEVKSGEPVAATVHLQALQTRFATLKGADSDSGQACATSAGAGIAKPGCRHAGNPRTCSLRI